MASLPGLFVQRWQDIFEHAYFFDVVPDPRETTRSVKDPTGDQRVQKVLCTSGCTDDQAILIESASRYFCELIFHAREARDSVENRVVDEALFVESFDLRDDVDLVPRIGTEVLSQTNCRARTDAAVGEASGITYVHMVII